MTVALDIDNVRFVFGDIEVEGGAGELLPREE